jgi:hypothetical protein
MEVWKRRLRRQPKQPMLQPLLQRPGRRRLLSERKRHRRLAPVAADAESVEVRIPDEPASVAQGLVASGTATRATSHEIQEVKEAGASLSQGVAGNEACTLELARVLWASSSGLGANSEDDEEVVSCNTLERGMTWARRAFDELILPATSVCFLVRGVASQSCDSLGLCHLSLSRRLQVLESSGRRRAREVWRLRVERT